MAVKITGPIEVKGNEIYGTFSLELSNVGNLPANIAKPELAIIPWDLDQSTTKEPMIDHVIKIYLASDIKRQGVVFPQQTANEPGGLTMRTSEAMVGINSLNGLVLVIRGAVKYDWTGADKVHHTTFHVHVVYRHNPDQQYIWSGLPWESLRTIPVANLFVTNSMGRTEAT